MNFSEIYNAIKSNFAGLLTFIIFFATALVFWWDEYKEVQADKEAVSTQLLSLKDAEVHLEKEKALLYSALKDKEFELLTKENDMKKNNADLEKRIVELTNSLSNKQEFTSDSIKIKEKKLSILIDEYEEKIKEVNNLYSYYSHEELKAKAEELIIKAMNDFSDLGVNIREPDWCDKEYMSRYYKGKALIDQISALNNKYKISDEYTWFVRTHSRSSISSSDGECKSNKQYNSNAANHTVH